MPGDVDMGVDPSRHHGVAAEVVIGRAAAIRCNAGDFSVLHRDADVMLHSALAIKQRAGAQRDRLGLRRGDATKKKEKCCEYFSHPLPLATSYRLLPTVIYQHHIPVGLS